MADTTPQEPQEPQDGTTEPQGEQTPTEPDPQEGEENPDARGSKAQVIDDLAKERKRRQSADSRVGELETQLSSILETLGIKGDGDKVDPDKLATDLATQRAENAVLRAGNGIADVDALLDSRAFTDSLRDIDSSDRDAVKAHITEYVTAHPRFAVTPQAHGVRDAAAGADRQPAPQGDWIRNAARR